MNREKGGSGLPSESSARVSAGYPVTYQGWKMGRSVVASTWRETNQKKSLVLKKNA
jgi:hypothetical protein